MPRCKFRHMDNSQCEYNAIQKPDKSQDVIIEKIKSHYHNTSPSTQAYYPFYPEGHNKYCYYHDKLMKGKIDDHRGQNIKTRPLAGRY